MRISDWSSDVCSSDLPTFAMAKLLFAVTGASFGLIKVSVYSSIGLVTEGPAQHASLTNVNEGLFMVGVMSGYWIFGAFIDHAAHDSLDWLDVYWLLAALAFGGWIGRGSGRERVGK